MKAIVINPQKRIVAQHDFRSALRSFQSVFNEPRLVGRLPNGDAVWADTDRIHRWTFSIGGGPQIVGNAIIVGRKDEGGDYTSPRSHPDSIRQIVRFSELFPFEVETTPDTVTPAIERFVAELKSGPAVIVRVASAPGARVGRCWENVNTAVRLWGGHLVHGWAIWERPMLFLTAEFHAVWSSPDGEVIDVTPKADHEKRILFSADPRYPATFNFLQRPSNRRFRLYRAEPDASAMVGQLSSAKQAYELRQATKRGLSLEQHLASKVPLDPLEELVERLFAVCTEIDSLVEVTWDGLTSDHPERVAGLNAEKVTLHDEILRLAGEKFGNGAPALQTAEP